MSITILNPEYSIMTPVINLQDYISGLSSERFKTYSKEWIRKFPNKSEIELSKSPSFILLFIENNMKVLNILSQHPELLNNDGFKTKYRFLEQDIENLRSSILLRKKTIKELLKNCSAAMELMDTVCNGLESLDSTCILSTD